MNRSTWLKVARLVISAGLIAYLVIRLDFGQIVNHLRGVAPGPLLLGAAMIFGMTFTNSIRWKVILAAKGIRMPLGKLLYYYLMGIFFSSFLPTSVGGDVARVVAVARETDKRADAFASVVIERLQGFFILLPVGLVSIPFVAGRLTEWRLVLVVGIITVLVFAVAYILLLRPVARRLFGLLGPVLNLLERFRARERLEKAHEAIVTYSGSNQAIYGGLALSLLSKLSWILGCYFVGRAFSLNLAFTTLMLVVPVVELVRMVPISISGIGVREAAFVTMLRQFGIEDSLGFAFAVVVYVIFFGFGLVGGILYGTRQFAGGRRGVGR
jgi:uncharacterized protein (TIRG00374 family)